MRFLLPLGETGPRLDEGIKRRIQPSLNSLPEGEGAEFTVSALQRIAVNIQASDASLVHALQQCRVIPLNGAVPGESVDTTLREHRSPTTTLLVIVASRFTDEENVEERNLARSWNDRMRLRIMIAAITLAIWGETGVACAQNDLPAVEPTTPIGKMLQMARSGRCVANPDIALAPPPRVAPQTHANHSHERSPFRTTAPTYSPIDPGSSRGLSLSFIRTPFSEEAIRAQSGLSSQSKKNLQRLEGEQPAPAEQSYESVPFLKRNEETQPSPSDIPVERLPWPPSEEEPSPSDLPAGPSEEPVRLPLEPQPEVLPSAPAPEFQGPIVAPQIVQPADQPVLQPETWWSQHVVRPLKLSQAATPITIDSLLVDTLRHSAKVQAISDNALIAQTSIVRAEAEFDVHAFMESKFVRTSVPTGSTLEAGFNVPRLREEDWFVSGGLRRKNLRGGQFEISQRNGLKASNSQFFVPSQQANSRLTLGYKQPLLNGSGEAFNSSLIVLADIDTRIAANRSTAELQEHLLAVTDAAWELYYQRSVLLQKKRHLANAAVILEKLESRRELDSLESQIARARSAVAMRKAELIRAVTAIRNAESRLRALVNSPEMLSNRTAELVPTEPLTTAFIPVSLKDAVFTAMENRPEINSATQEIEAARVRLNVAKNELMPMLDLVLETYVSGLQGNFGVGQSILDQFSTGEPAYTAGLVFEVPLQRRAARANFQKRRVELRQLSRRLQSAIETLHADVEVAVREVETTHRELQARQQAMQASITDVRYQQRRWEELAGDDRSASFLLADLLDAQNRLVFEENGVSRAQVDYALSLVRLRRATGTLLKHERIELVRTIDNGLPAIHFEKK